MKFIVLTCVFRRRLTFNYCIGRMPEIERHIVYSNDEDKKELNNAHWYKHQNRPISNKWNYGLKQLKDVEFDYVIMMGSDNWFCEDFLKVVEENIKGYDVMGFEDLYIEDFHNREAYYFGGYKGKRRGKLIGAGMIYSKEFLKTIDFNLWNKPINKGLDSLAWSRLGNAKIKRMRLSDNELILCDVKDGQGLTPIHRIKGLKKL